MKRKSTIKLKVVLTSDDLKSSANDAFDLAAQFDALIKRFKGKSKVQSQELSIQNSNPIPQLGAELKRIAKLQRIAKKPSRTRKT